MAQENKPKVTGTVAGTFTTSLFEVSYEDKANPSENGLGFVTHVSAPSEEVARQWFEESFPDCEVTEIQEEDSVLCPALSLVEEEEGEDAPLDGEHLYRRLDIRTNRLKRLMGLKAPYAIVRTEMHLIQKAVNELFDHIRETVPHDDADDQE